MKEKEMKKYKFVMGFPEKGEVQIDVRDSRRDSKTIGHLVLSESGLGWKSVRRQKIDTAKIPWDRVASAIGSWQDQNK